MGPGIVVIDDDDMAMHVVVHLLVPAHAADHEIPRRRPGIRHDPVRHDSLTRRRRAAYQRYHGQPV